MCHAAAWVIEGVKKPPHGEVFQRWGSRGFLITGLPVTRCHNYNVTYRHNWRCIGCIDDTDKTNVVQVGVVSNRKSGCGAVIGRHSKSIDVTRQICARCKGKLQYIGRDVNCVNSACKDGKSGGFVLEKEPPPFAKFVKEHYKTSKLHVQKEKRLLVTHDGKPRIRAPSPRSPLPQVTHANVMAHLSKQWADRDM